MEPEPGSGNNSYATLETGYMAGRRKAHLGPCSRRLRLLHLGVPRPRRSPVGQELIEPPLHGSARRPIEPVGAGASPSGLRGAIKGQMIVDQLVDLPLEWPPLLGWISSPRGARGGGGAMVSPIRWHVRQRPTPFCHPLVVCGRSPIGSREPSPRTDRRREGQ